MEVEINLVTHKKSFVKFYEAFLCNAVASLWKVFANRFAFYVCYILSLQTCLKVWRLCQIERILSCFVVEDSSWVILNLAKDRNF